MNKSILITRPDHSSRTHYFCYWYDDIIELAREKGMDIFDLKAEKATREQFAKVMETNPSMLIFNGSKDMEKLLGFYNEVLMDKDSVCLFPSKTSGVIGIRDVNSASVAYIGHIDDFVLCCCPFSCRNPLDDDLAHLFLDPLKYLTECLLAGMTAERTVAKVNRLYKRNIKSITSKRNSKYDFAVPYLFWNMNHLKLIGDREVKVI